MEINGKKITKAAKTMAKSDSLFLGRSGEHYYICNGFWLVKVHRQWYNEIFRPVSARFVELEDGQGANTRDNKAIPDKSEPIDFKNIIGENICTSENQVDITSYLAETERNGLVRIIENKETMMTVNNDFMEMMKNLMGEVNWYGTENVTYKPIYTDFDQDLAGLVLPVRPDAVKSSYKVVRKSAVA